MALLNINNLPKEIPANDFDAFLEKTKQSFPADQFPEIFVEYYQAEDKMILLGMGISSECARQSIQALEKMPSLKGQTRLKILRMPRMRVY